MRDFLKNFRKSESGATLVEYGIALILAIIVGGTALVTLAGGVNTNLDEACNLTNTALTDSGNGALTTGCPDA